VSSSRRWRRVLRRGGGCSAHTVDHRLSSVARALTAKKLFSLVFMATSSSRAAPDFAATASSHIGFRQLDPIEIKAPLVLPSATTIAATAPRYGEPPLATRSQGLCLSACLDDNSRTLVRKLAGPLERTSKLYLSAHTPHVLASRSACACMCTKFVSLANPERHVLCTCRASSLTRKFPPVRDATDLIRRGATFSSRAHAKISTARNAQRGRIRRNRPCCSQQHNQ
jgi:hypothetical protein